MEQKKFIIINAIDIKILAIKICSYLELMPSNIFPKNMLTPTSVKEAKTINTIAKYFETVVLAFIFSLPIIPIAFVII